MRLVLIFSKIGGKINLQTRYGLHFFFQASKGNPTNPAINQNSNEWTMALWNKGRKARSIHSHQLKKGIRPKIMTARNGP